MEKKLKKHTHRSDGKCCQPELIETLSTALKNWKTTEATDSSKKSAKPVNSGDGVARNIEKHILHGSAGVIPPGCEAPGGGLAYPKESKFVFHYRIRKVDDDHTVLDDTRKYGKSMELYSGKEFQLDFWEHCLGTMLPGEVASFLVPPERLLAFPAVNKKLRDYMLDKKGHAVKHCCGLMSLQEQGGLGYPDLDELMMKPEPLEFIFELLRTFGKLTVFYPCSTQQYYAAIESTSEALSRDPKNVKALYRRSKAYSETWDLDLSAADLRKVADLMPDMTAAVNVELQALEAKRAEQALKERRLLAGKLSARSPSSPPTDQVQSKPKITN
ncbi:hypothetical protein X801_07496 [Opisthorchis viverrini]|uniref:AIP/AIPL N-terminal FKBP-type PPIase domain-containing protein n=1 Tax=Opisthorchis viverrini TaxID=6198 RepID=A0A1S8WQF8_OPIVI|nr:hypothetical protein X801_07496 [Opisthorchis viverrini]